MQEIKTINADEAFKMVEDNNCNLIDIREARELEKTGSVENSVHISRGMLEIFLDPNSVFFQKGKLDSNKEMILFCGGWMVKDSIKYYIPKFFIIISLILVYLVGPIGLFVYWIIKIFFAKKISLYD